MVMTCQLDIAKKLGFIKEEEYKKLRQSIGVLQNKYITPFTERKSKMNNFSISTSSDIGIRVNHVSKKYCKSLKRSMFYGVKDIGRNVLGTSSHSENLRKDEFWAIDDVSFEAKKGGNAGSYWS